jgi:hypothetical protein
MFPSSLLQGSVAKKLLNQSLAERICLRHDLMNHFCEKTFILTFPQECPKKEISKLR